VPSPEGDSDMWAMRGIYGLKPEAKNGVTSAGPDFFAALHYPAVDYGQKTSNGIPVRGWYWASHGCKPVEKHSKHNKRVSAGDGTFSSQILSELRYFWEFFHRDRPGGNGVH